MSFKMVHVYKITIIPKNEQEKNGRKNTKDIFFITSICENISMFKLADKSSLILFSFFFKSYLVI